MVCVTSDGWGLYLYPSRVGVTPRRTDSTREFENLSNEAEELCSSSRIYVTPIWSYQQ